MHYVPKILDAEGKVVSAVGEYDSTGDLAKVDAAVNENIKLLKEMRAKIARQSAGSRRVKLAKKKFKKALTRVIQAEGSLEGALALKSSNPEAATSEANNALAAIKTADKELSKAASLLG
jgi:multidrug resistance efflux pump